MRHSTVLLVGDELDLREGITEFLQSGGHTVLAAESAQEACRLAVQHKAEIQMLLTHAVLKGGNGKQLFK